ncbi:MAG: M20/M25/M40 family metallo-hydrolase [Bacteroidales bacterium]|nr:M20/M25/M40 family metallo-hydrolase [Bacteroidales bacterium]
MDIDFFNRILSVDSTSGKEGELADMLSVEFAAPGRKVELFEVGDGTKNLLVSWGSPKLIFCTHLDTVPPYIAPYSESVCHPERSEGSSTQELVIHGRGTCDAKGQLFAMWEACKELEAKGCTDFGLLLLAGEETGSFGAKAFRDQHSGAEWLVVGEPTDNCMATAAKGTKSFEVTFEGKAFHSGYPENGVSAVELFNDFMNALRSIRFPKDELLGDTTFNVGKLVSDNPQNILSEKLTCRVYFRTTFESDEMVCNVMKNMAGPEAKLRFGRPRVQDGSDIVAKDVAQWQRAMTVKAFGGDAPTRFEVLPGFETKPVSFGSDAPQLSNFKHKILCGPGSILVAHRPEEYITLADLRTAVGNYVEIYNRLIIN